MLADDPVVCYPGSAGFGTLRPCRQPRSSTDNIANIPRYVVKALFQGSDRMQYGAQSCHYNIITGVRPRRESQARPVLPDQTSRPLPKIGTACNSQTWHRGTSSDNRIDSHYSTICGKAGWIVFGRIDLPAMTQVDTRLQTSSSSPLAL